jgi:hypothetical protein
LWGELLRHRDLRAQHAYRLRFLTGKYHLDPTRWAPEIVDSESTQVPFVDEFIENELALEPTDDTGSNEDDQDDEEVDAGDNSADDSQRRRREVMTG